MGKGWVLILCLRRVKGIFLMKFDIEFELMTHGNPATKPCKAARNYLIELPSEFDSVFQLQFHSAGG